MDCFSGWDGSKCDNFMGIFVHETRLSSVVFHFIHNGYIRKLSNEYAIYLYRFCKRVLSSQESHQKFDHNMWKSTNNNRYKAQYWIDEYERLKSNGELDFIKKYKQ